MEVNLNQAMFRADYMREVYSSRNPVSNNNRAGQDLISVREDERDIAIISEEARRLQHSTKAMGSNESSLDQQRDILIPGQDQTELKPDAGLEPSREFENSEQTPAPEIIEEQAVEYYNLERSESSRSGAVETEAAESREASAEQPVEAAENQQDNTSTQANINNINRSSLVQAYASAANVTQATLTVNFKV